MTKMEDKIKEGFEKWVEWKLYKILYVMILVPFLIEEAKSWIFKDFFVSIIFFITAIILLLPILFKTLNILKIMEDFK